MISLKNIIDNFIKDKISLALQASILTVLKLKKPVEIAAAAKAIIATSMGYEVAKHGSRSASSNSKYCFIYRGKTTILYIKVSSLLLLVNLKSLFISTCLNLPRIALCNSLNSVILFLLDLSN
jgi:hypothetical protein